MVSLLLLQQITQLFIFMFLGWLLVHIGILKSSDSRVLSLIILYAVWPCVTINTFQVNFTLDLLLGLVFALTIVIAIHVVQLILIYILKKPLRLQPVEQASIFYPNIGLTIPILTTLLGREWVIFSSVFIMVQQMFLWSQGKMLLSGERHFSLRKILLNINILSVFAGACLFFLRVSLPSIISSAVTTMANTFAPLSMLVTGMLIGSTNLRTVITRKGIWKVAILRLIICPLVILCFFKLFRVAVPASDFYNILLVCFLAVSSPSASAVTQMAQVYSKEAGEYAGTINIVSTLLCIITMPLMLMMFQL